MVGGINLDTLARVNDPVVAATSNPGRTLTAPGGVGRNVAENLARLGSPVRLVGAVGCDHAGDLLLAGLADLGVDASGVRRRADLTTGTYTAVLDHDGSLVVGIADMAATDAITPADLPADLLDGAAWLVLDGNLPTATVQHCLTAAATIGVPVALDPVGVAKAARLGSLRGVHTFTPNADELAAWSGSPETEVAVERAQADDVAVVWLRAGAAGSTVVRPGHDPVTVALPPAPVVDVTGAGDAMLAAYVHRMLREDDAVAAAWFGAAAAWLTVGSASAVHPDLTEALVAATLKQQRRTAP